MNYYEELGLSSAAGEDEIRKAYRTLSKLLHPDLQTDPAVRETAEIQMRRINAIVEVLLDPERRDAYDESLRARPPERRFIPLARRLRLVPANAFRFLSTVLSGVLLTLGALWFFGGDSIQFGKRSTDIVPAVTAQPVEAATAAPPLPVRTSTEKSAARNSPSVLKTVAIPAIQQPPAAAPDRAQVESATPPKPSPAERGDSAVIARNAPPAVADTPAPPPVAPPPSPARPSAAPGLNGFWVYATEAVKSGPAKMALYSPEYVQLRIHTEGGTLHGDYSSRYRVHDLPLSPDVAFHFEGKTDAASFAWRASDDSQGTVDIKALTPQSMQVNWRVTTFGSHITLGAGTAVLIRSAEP